MPTIPLKPRKKLEVFAIVTGDDKLVSLSLNEQTARNHMVEMGGGLHGWRIVRYYQNNPIENLLTFDGSI
jgi:hypothetical protein